MQLVRCFAVEHWVSSKSHDATATLWKKNSEEVEGSISFLQKNFISENVDHPNRIMHTSYVCTRLAEFSVSTMQL
jgi:hypothetical protein